MEKKNKRPTLIAGARVAATMACLLLPLLARAQKVDSRPCENGMADCFFADDIPPVSPAESSDYSILTPGPSRVVNMYVRTLHGGPLAHHWIEVESSHGLVTVGFGPASIPFIDAGQISIWYAHGEVERRGAIRLISTGFNYAKPPGTGHAIGKPIQLTIARSDAFIEKERRRKLVFPYIPLFHDCRTFVCAVQSSVRGKSTLPCYLLFKGYW
jgi:hypothetical protein